MAKKLLIIANLDKAFLSHRLPLALAAMAEGYEVHFAAQMTDDGAEEVRSHGIHAYPLPLVRGFQGFFKEAKAIVSILGVIRKVRPHVVHAVTIKPVLYGGLFTRMLRIPVVAAIPGLGYTFMRKGLKGALIQVPLVWAYKLAIGHPKASVIVQNRDDENFVIKTFGVAKERLHYIRGSGVALEDYPFRPEPEGRCQVTLASRMLLDKGVGEFIQAAEILAPRFPSTRFVLAGPLDPGNPTSLTEADMERVRSRGVVTWIGNCEDVPQLMSDSHIVVLPSYREGLPKILIEAAASGRSVVTTDVPGCREAIIPGESGVLVPARDPEALAAAIADLLLDAPHRQRMGKTGRALSEAHFDIREVVAQHLLAYGLAYGRG